MLRLERDKAVPLTLRYLVTRSIYYIPGVIRSSRGGRSLRGPLFAGEIGRERKQ